MPRVRQQPSLPLEWGERYRLSLLDQLRELCTGLFTAQEYCWEIKFGNETDAIAVGTKKVTFFTPWPLRLHNLIVAVDTPQTSGSILTFDVNVAGTSILSTKITVDNGDYTSADAATPLVFNTSDPTYPALTRFSVDVDQIGDGTAKAPALLFYAVRL